MIAPPAPAIGIGELTARELELLALMAQGLSNTAIGQELCLSPKTVECHVRNIFQKLDLAQGADQHRRVLAVLAYLGSRSEPARLPLAA